VLRKYVFVAGADLVEGSLTCIAALPQGSLAWIMEGDRDSVLEATDVACEQALSEFGGRPPLGLPPSTASLARGYSARASTPRSDGSRTSRLAHRSPGSTPTGKLRGHAESTAFTIRLSSSSHSRDAVTAPSGWATQQLAEFLAVLTGAADDQAAVADALERLAESFEADAGAFLREGCVISSLGWATGCTPDAELAAAATNDRAGIELPGVGWC
jgi:hypothetical protein